MRIPGGRWVYFPDRAITLALVDIAYVPHDARAARVAAYLRERAG